MGASRGGWALSLLHPGSASRPPLVLLGEQVPKLCWGGAGGGGGPPTPASVCVVGGQQWAPELASGLLAAPSPSCFPDSWTLTQVSPHRGHSLLPLRRPRGGLAPLQACSSCPSCSLAQMAHERGPGGSEGSCISQAGTSLPIPPPQGAGVLCASVSPAARCTGV